MGLTLNITSQISVILRGAKRSSARKGRWQNVYQWATVRYAVAGSISRWYSVSAGSGFITRSQSTDVRTAVYSAPRFRRMNFGMWRKFKALCLICSAATKSHILILESSRIVVQQDFQLNMLQANSGFHIRGRKIVCLIRLKLWRERLYIRWHVKALSPWQTGIMR